MNKRVAGIRPRPNGPFLGLESLEDRRLLSASSVAFESLATTPLAPRAIGDASVSYLGSGSLDRNAIFNLNSKPDSNFTIYLDFDGHVTEGTIWNSSYGIDTIVSPPFDLDGDATGFGQAELERILISWRRTAEDFAPFDINVTTRDPGLDALTNTGGGDTRWGARAVATFDTFAACGCGGHAYLNTFADSVDTPTFVYNLGEDSLGETFSHEVGHMMSLLHDGTSSGGLVYYPGHGTGQTGWGAIMGAPFNQNVTQWDQGEYFDSNNGEDDLAAITTLNGFDYRPDDFGDAIASADPLQVTAGSQLSAFGIIERTNDRDLFSFEAGTGSASFTIEPLETRPNLDVWAGLYDAGGNLIAESNPSDVLSASFSGVNLTDGTYFLRVEGVGSHDVYNPVTDNVDPPAFPAPWQVNPATGYSDYGSLGQYAISGTIAAPAGNAFSVTAIDADKLEGNTGQTSFEFTVTRMGDTSGPASVDFAYSATLPSVVGDTYPLLADATDFVGGTQFTGTIDFVAGQADATITWDVVGDTDFEQDEFFSVALSNPSPGWRLADSQATGTVRSDETRIGIPALTGDLSVNEGPFDGVLIRWRQIGAANGAFDNWALDNVSLENSSFNDDFDPNLDATQWSVISNAEVNTDFGGPNGNALYFTGGPDRRAVTNLLNPTPGDLLSFDIIFGDSANGGENADPGEDVILEFSSDGGSTWTVISTLDTEDYTSWTSISVPLPAGIDSNPPSTLVFEIAREGGLSQSATVDWQIDTTGLTDPADANDFLDGVLPGGQALFVAGSSTTQIVVSIQGDVDFEPNESLTLRLLSAGGSGLVTIDVEADEAHGTILNDDSSFNINPGAQYRWRQLDYTAGLFDEWAIDNVNIAGLVSDDFDPDIDQSQWQEIQQGTANSNFGGPNGNGLFFTGGDASRVAMSNRVAATLGDTISFDIIYGNDVNGGENPEPGEDVVLEYSLDGNSWSLINTYNSQLLTTWTTITEMVPAPAIADPPVRDEGDAGVTTYTFEVQRIGLESLAESVTWQVLGSGTHPADAADFPGNVLPTGSVMFAPGETLQTVEIQVVGDSLFEADETFDFVLNASGDNTTVTATIVNDDAPPNGDFNGDGEYDCFDVDQLVANLANQTGNLLYDVDGSGVLDSADLTAWLAIAGSINLGSGASYLVGDANLDGTVDGQDFIIWNMNKFTAGNGWCGGDFNADGVTDGADFILWNSEKFTSSAIAVSPSASLTSSHDRDVNASAVDAAIARLSDKSAPRPAPVATAYRATAYRANGAHGGEFARRADRYFASQPSPAQEFTLDADWHPYQQ